MLLPIKLLATAATAVGMLIAASGGLDYWERHQAQRWSEVEAIVVSSSVCSWRASKGGMSHAPQITYTYAIGTQTYQGKSVRFGPRVVDRSEAEELVQRFSTGAHVVAYVDPVDHRRVVLDRDRVSGALKWKFGVGLSFLVIGALLLSGLRKAQL